MKLLHSCPGMKCCLSGRNVLEKRSVKTTSAPLYVTPGGPGAAAQHAGLAVPREVVRHGFVEGDTAVVVAVTVTGNAGPPSDVLGGVVEPPPDVPHGLGHDVAAPADLPHEGAHHVTAVHAAPLQVLAVNLHLAPLLCEIVPELKVNSL